MIQFKYRGYGMVKHSHTVVCGYYVGLWQGRKRFFHKAVHIHKLNSFDVFLTIDYLLPIAYVIFILAVIVGDKSKTVLYIWR